MKKNEREKVKKLRLSRETLRALTAADARMVAGGTNEIEIDSCQSGCAGCRTTVSHCDSG